MIVEFFPCLPWRVRVLGWMGMVAPAGTSPEISVDLNVRGLDDGPPFLNFGFVIDCECLRCLLLGRWDNLAEFEQPLLYLGVSERRTDHAIELDDDVVRGSLSEQPPPFRKSDGAIRFAITSQHVAWSPAIGDRARLGQQNENVEEPAPECGYGCSHIGPSGGP